MVAHMIEGLAAAVDEVWVVSSPSLALPELEAQVVEDREPHLGPLAGIAEGLEAMSAERAFVVSTDAPFLDADFAQELLSRGEAVAVREAGYVQTLAAVYPKRAAGLARELIEAGKRRPLDLLDSLGAEILASESMSRAPDLRAMNTPEAYLAAVREDDPQATAWAEFFGRARLATKTRKRERPIAKLGDFLASAAPELPWIEDGTLRTEYLVSLEGREFVRNPELPLGAGERVIILDAPAGG